jgi:DNA-binding SARP family transcriptional activator
MGDGPYAAKSEFCILGPLDVRVNGRNLELTSRRRATILAVLLLSNSSPVPVSRLIDSVWDGNAPETATKQVRNAISVLRQDLADSGTPIALTSGGYRLQLAHGALDAAEFTQEVKSAKGNARSGRAAKAIRSFRDALALWRGPVLAGFDHLAHHPRVVELSEQRVAALEDLVELELAQGAHRQLARELPVWLAEYPTHERLAYQLMVALSRSGATARALGVYEQTRSALDREFGINPGPEMSRLRRRLLDERDDEPALTPGRGSR